MLCGTEQGMDGSHHKPVTTEAPTSRKDKGKEKMETQTSGRELRDQNNLQHQCRDPRVSTFERIYRKQWGWGGECQE